MDQAATVDELAAHVLDATDDERARWVVRHNPRAPHDPNWWLFLLLNIKYEMEHRSQGRLRWARLYVWAVRHAADTGAFTADESAERIAAFVAELRYSPLRSDQLLADVADALPATDEIVRACLAQLPLTFDTIPDTTDLRLLDIATIRRSRLTKRLVRKASWHRADVRDPALAAELDGWIEALPRLV